MKKITINESGQDQDGNLYDPRSDRFIATGVLISHTPLRLSNSVTYSAYFFTTNLNEIVTPASPLAVTISPGPEDAIVVRFVGTATLFYSAEVAMQIVSGAITYNLDFFAGHAKSP